MEKRTLWTLTGNQIQSIEIESTGDVFTDLTTVKQQTHADDVFTAKPNLDTIHAQKIKQSLHLQRAWNQQHKGRIE